MATAPAAHFPRIYYLPHRYVGPESRFPQHLDRCRDMGFSHVLTTPPFYTAPSGDVFLTADHDRLDTELHSTRGSADFLRWLAEQCAARGLALLLDLPIDQFAAEHPLVGQMENCFSLCRDSYTLTIDPRLDVRPSGIARARFIAAECQTPLIDWWLGRMTRYAELGVAGFRIPAPGAVPPDCWRRLIPVLRNRSEPPIFIASTYGMSRDAVRQLDGCGFDYLQSSLPWWDFRSSWLVEEYEVLRLIAPLIAAPEDPLGLRLPADSSLPRRMKAAYERMLTLACGTGCGMMIPMGFEIGMRERYDPCLSREADFAKAIADAPFDLTPQIRAANDFVRQEPLLRNCGSLRALTGPNARVTALLRRDNSPSRATDDALLILVNPDQEQPSKIQDWQIVPGIGAVAETIRPLEAHSPDVELTHETAVLLAPGEARLLRIGAQKAIKPRLTSRKRLEAASKAPRIVIENVMPSASQGEAVKYVIGDALRVEADVLCDGRQWLGIALCWRASDESGWHRQKMNFIGADRWSGTFFLSRLGRYEFAVEAWIDRYGAFQHELLEKVEARVDLGAHLAMGKAVLENAGRLSKSGAPAALQARIARFDSLKEEEQIAMLLAPDTANEISAAGDRPFSTYSPIYHVESERAAAAFGNWYKISFADGVENQSRLDTAIRDLPMVRSLGFNVASLALPQLSGPRDSADRLESWPALFERAKGYGIEVAIEFPLRGVINAGPPGYRADDSMNMQLWTRLRDLWKEWLDAGLKIFCLREPDGMPFAFWRWAIEDLKRHEPNAVFVAGYSGSDKMAYRLAKEGFAQSLTALPWPMNKFEAMRYFLALQQASQRKQYRPHFRINAAGRRTHDEAPRSGADFLAQCALAATLSGSWGIAQGADSLLLGNEGEAPNSTYAHVLARLNWLREANPALQSHRDLMFYNAYDERVIYYGRSMPEREDIILVAVNMAPHVALETAFEVPLWEWGLPDHAAVDVDDLIAERRFVWQGKIQHVAFDAHHPPFAVWRIQPRRMTS